MRETMAARGIKTVTALVELLRENGYEISVSQLGRMIGGKKMDAKSQFINLRIVEGLMMVLDCDLDGVLTTKEASCVPRSSAS